MPLSLIIKDVTGVIVGYGFCSLTPGTGESVIEIPRNRVRELENFKDDQGRLRLRWNSILGKIEEVPEVDREVHISASLIALRAEFKALPTIAEKLQFLARRLGLIE